MSWPELFQFIGIVYSAGIPIGFVVALIQNWDAIDRWDIAVFGGLGWPVLLLASTIMAD